MTHRSRRERFRAILDRDACIYPGSVFDPMSARIAEDLGFEVGMLGGSVASMVVLGAPDLFVLTLTELAEQVRRICRAGDLPLLVDADHGYGNALNAMRTVEELEAAGVAALTIEDTQLPLPFGATERETLIPIEEGVGKMRAALQGRSDPALVVVGRTSAPAITGIADAIARCRAYEAADVDALFVKGLRSRADLDALRSAVRLPLILDGAADELDDLAYLALAGVRIALQGHQPFMAGVAAVHAALKALRDGTAPADLPGIPPARFGQDLTRAPLYREWVRDFLNP